MELKLQQLEKRINRRKLNQSNSELLIEKIKVIQSPYKYKENTINSPREIIKQQNTLTINSFNRSRKSKQGDYEFLDTTLSRIDNKKSFIINKALINMNDALIHKSKFTPLPNPDKKFDLKSKNLNDNIKLKFKLYFNEYILKDTPSFIRKQNKFVLFS